MKKIIVIIISLISLSILSIVEVSAHSVQLNVSYDDCVPLSYVDSNNIGDGYSEKWYEFIDDSQQSEPRIYHIPHSSSVTTIKYYFEPTSRGTNPPFSWSSYLGETEANILFNGLRTSMEKWNNVYFYI